MGRPVKFAKIGSAPPVTATLPKPWSSPPPADSESLNAICQVFVQDLNNAFSNIGQRDSQSPNFGSLFLSDGSTLWRDHLLLTWDFRCFRGSGGILSTLRSRGKSFSQSISFRLDGADRTTASRPPEVGYLNLARDIPCIVCFTSVTTSIGTGRGIFRLVQDAEDEGRWKAAAVYTALQQLEGTIEQHAGSLHHSNGLHVNEKLADPEQNGSETRSVPSSDCTVLAVGGSHSGLFTAARLKAAGVNTLVIDKSSTVGDSWRHRYQGLVLHDTCYYNEFPYLKYPKDWPIYPTKSQFADFLKTYAETLQLPISLNTELLTTEWDQDKQRWNVRVRLNGDSSLEYLVHPRYLIHAASLYGQPKIPMIPGINTFSGDRLIHSSAFTSAADCSGKAVVVVGAGTSAHDIASEYALKGAKVTMIQRSSTMVASQKVVALLTGRLYNESSPPADAVDFEANSLPRPIHKLLNQQVTKHFADTIDNDLLVGLEKAGFALNLGVDEAGMFFQLLESAGGFYQDVGASQLIIDGRISVVNGQVARISERAVILADGSSLPADDIILATGYEGMDTYIRRLYGGTIAGKLGKVWGLNEEGELRNVGKTNVPQFYIIGGNIAQARLLSKQVALLIKAEEDKLVG